VEPLKASAQLACCAGRGHCKAGGSVGKRFLSSSIPAELLGPLFGAHLRGCTFAWQRAAVRLSPAENPGSWCG